MNNLKEMSLVEGEVVFKVNIAMLVKREEAENVRFIEELLRQKAIEEVDGSDVEVEYENEVPVTISQKTADRFYHISIGNSNWNGIITEHKDNIIK